MFRSSKLNHISIPAMSRTRVCALWVAPVGFVRIARIAPAEVDP